MFLLTQVYRSVVQTDETTKANHLKQKSSDINIAGDWVIKLTSNQITKQGMVSIFQNTGSLHVQIVGQLDHRTFYIRTRYGGCQPSFNVCL